MKENMNCTENEAREDGMTLIEIVRMIEYLRQAGLPYELICDCIRYMATGHSEYNLSKMEVDTSGFKRWRIH